MNFAAPWFYYLIITGIMILTISRKIISVTNQIMGAEFGDSIAQAVSGKVRTATATTGAVTIGGAGMAASTALPVVGSGLVAAGQMAGRALQGAARRIME